MHEILENVSKNLTESPLGKNVPYKYEYAPEFLYEIPRKRNRAKINIIDTALPFYGFDVWNAFEISWLNQKGKPEVAIGEIRIPCNTPNTIESKSLKLYLNSFANTKFSSIDVVKDTITKDLNEHVEGGVEVKLDLLSTIPATYLTHFDGICLDTLDIECDTYNLSPELLRLEKASKASLTKVSANISETLFSNLFHAHCLITAQPDWASIKISYTGQKICRESLLKYLISFRNHNSFHEDCVERIFIDIMAQCKPIDLTIDARFTRRGGLDISPYRSSSIKNMDNRQDIRLIRQ